MKRVCGSHTITNNPCFMNFWKDMVLPQCIDENVLFLATEMFHITKGTIPTLVRNMIFLNRGNRHELKFELFRTKNLLRITVRSQLSEVKAKWNPCKILVLFEADV